MNTAVVSVAMIYINSTVIKEAFQRNWLSPFASPDSSPFRVLVTSLRVMVWAPKVPPGPHPLVDMDSSLTFASPVITRYPLMLQLGGLEQCE